jgi:hypothetical protein
MASPTGSFTGAADWVSIRVRVMTSWFIA